MFKNTDIHYLSHATCANFCFKFFAAFLFLLQNLGFFGERWESSTTNVLLRQNFDCNLRQSFARLAFLLLLRCLLWRLLKLSFELNESLTLHTFHVLKYLHDVVSLSNNRASFLWGLSFTACVLFKKLCKFINQLVSKLFTFSHVPFFFVALKSNLW